MRATMHMKLQTFLIAHPVFLDAGFDVVAWEEYAHRGVVFRRARMRKKLR